MRRLLAASVFSLACLTASPAMAVMEDYPSVKLQGLDKSVGRTVTFEAKVGSTIQYGPLYIKIQSCRKAPPIEKPESAAFLQIWEVPPGQDKSEWSFSGWMFASSPALSPMDHPVYDVWVLDCTGREEPNEEAAAAESNAKADQDSLPPDGEAATEQPVPADSEAEETGPVETETPIPTDMEAEPDSEEPAVSINPDAAPLEYPVADPNAPWSPNAYPQPQPQNAPQPIAPQPDPYNGTAYDIMKQQGTNASPPDAGGYVPQQQPGFDPNAPYSPENYPR